MILPVCLQKAHIAAQSAAPDLNNKQAWQAEIQDQQSELELAKLRAAMSYLYPASQVEFRQALLAKSLEKLAELDAVKDQQFLRFYNAYLVRGYCSADSNALLEKGLENNQDASLGTTKSLKIALQEDQRCMAMKALVQE